MELVTELRGEFGVEPVLRELNIPKPTYEHWVRRGQQPSARERRDADLLEAIEKIHGESGGVYGSPRVHAQLRREGEHVSRKRVERLMRQAGITGVAIGLYQHPWERQPRNGIYASIGKRVAEAAGALFAEQYRSA